MVSLVFRSKEKFIEKIAGEDFTIVSSSEKEIYTDIDKARKSELDSKRDKW